MKCYKIADLTVEMDSFGKTDIQSEPYMFDCFEQADIVISSEWKRYKERHPLLSDDTCEYYCTAQSFYRQLVNFDGLVLHSSAVMMDGKTFLFTAPCGTGKSTHTAFWLKQFGDRASILNDDKPALRRINGIWYAYGTPWSGKNDISINTRAPIAGICVLNRGEENIIERYYGPLAVCDILNQTTRSKSPVFMLKILTLIDKLLSEVPIWRMECNTDPEAALVSYRAMSGGKENNET